MPLLLLFRKRSRFAQAAPLQARALCACLFATNLLRFRCGGKGTRHLLCNDLTRRSKVRFAPAFFIKINHPPVPLLLLMRKRPRLLRLLACKRARYASTALPLFCGYHCGGKHPFLF